MYICGSSRPFRDELVYVYINTVQSLALFLGRSLPSATQVSRLNLTTQYFLAMKTGSVETQVLSGTQLSDIWAAAFLQSALTIWWWLYLGMWWSCCCRDGCRETSSMSCLDRGWWLWWHVRTWGELLHRARLSCRPTWQLHALHTVHSTDHNPHTRSYTLFIPADGPECYPCVFTCCNTLLFLHLPLPYCYVFLWVPALHATLKTIRSLSLYYSVHLYCLCHWLIDWCLDR